MSGPARWWVYQRERFPLGRNSALIAAFAFSAVAYSGFLRGHRGLPSLGSFAVAFVTSLAFFAQLRIADEHKDAEEDARFRAYRPVPRGLVTLRGLRRVALGAAVLQLVLAVVLAPKLVVLLAVTWLYLSLMTAEFFARDWLKARPLAYLFSHMLIMPLVDFYATACDWLPATGRPPDGLVWFLAMSFFSGIVLEVSRKLRAPEDEETGVETYTFLYGRRRAVAGWLVAIALGSTSVVMAAGLTGGRLPVAVVVALALAAAVLAGSRFLARSDHGTSRLLEPLGGTWVLAAYISLAAVSVVMSR